MDRSENIPKRVSCFNHLVVEAILFNQNDRNIELFLEYLQSIHFSPGQFSIVDFSIFYIVPDNDNQTSRYASAFYMSVK